MKIKDNLGDIVGAGKTYTSIGNVYYQQLNLEKALESYNKALEIARDNNDPNGLALNSNNMGLVYYDQNNMEKAIEHYRIAEDMYSELDDLDGLSMVYNNLGLYYNDNNDLDRAVGYYEKSLKIDRKTKRAYGITTTLINLGQICNKKDQFGKSISFLKEALEICENSGYPYLEKEVLNQLSYAYAGTGNYKLAYEANARYAEMLDTLTAVENRKIVSELETKYETEKKEIQISKQQTEIEKQTAINKAQELQLRQEKIIRYSIIGGLIMVIMFIIIVYRNYRIKKRANILLAEQNDQIMQQKEEIEAQRDEIAAQRDLAAEQRDLIAEQKQDITDSIQYAYKIQSAIFPTHDDIQLILKEYFILYKPRDIVSGDFYWIDKQDKKIIIIAADCTGHGVPGAFMSMLGVAFLNEIVNKENITSPADILNRLREDVILALKQHGDEGAQRDGMDVAAISIDTENMSVEFAGANNPLYYIRNNELIEIKGDKMPVSIYAKMHPFNNFQQKIEKGDCIYIFSDGYADQFGGPKGKKFKYKPFKELLVNNQDKTMIEQKEILDRTFEDWKGVFEQIDDVLIVGIKM